MKFITFKTCSVIAFGSVILCACNKQNHENTVPPVRVETLAVAESAIASGRTYSGVIEESTGTSLSFKIPGTLVRIAVEEGQFVNKGQLIAEVEATSLQSNLRIAEAAEATAQDAYNRMKMLHDANALPDMKWVEVQNQLSAAKSATQIARNSVGDARIYAPESGYISKKVADVGSTIAPGLPIVELVQIDPVKINISVSEDEISDINNDTEAHVSVSALDNFTTTAKLSDKGMIADPLSRTYTIKFSCANPDKKMLPGMLCNVSLSSNSTHNEMVLPVNAVLLDSENQTFVWLKKNGHSFKRLVTLGGYTSDGVVIDKGLAVGDSVIISGMQKVSEGMAVQSINSHN